MQRYGQIYFIVCYNCETHLPFYEETLLDFLTNTCRQIFSQMRACRFSHKCVQADFLTNATEQLPFPKTADGAVDQFTLVSRDPKHLFTFSGNTADQHEWGTGEFLSYYIYNWLHFT